MNNNNSPLVSIGLPVFNGQKFIEKSLKTLINQSYEHFELIISDNASTDRTSSICQNYALRDRRIHYFRQKLNVGIISNFTYVLNKAKGKYFMWASYDDRWDKDFIKILKKALDTHPDYGVAMSSVSRVDEEGLLVDKILLRGKNDLTNLDYISVAKKLLTGVRIHLYIYGLFRTKIIKKIMSRSFPQCIAGDRILITELALFTHFYSADRILFSKTISKEPIASRYSKEKLGQEWKSPTKHLHYISSMVLRLLNSPFIPYTRKVKIIPYLILFAFFNFYNIILDLIPFKKFFISSYRKIKN